MVQTHAGLVAGERGVHRGPQGGYGGRAVLGQRGVFADAQDGLARVHRGAEGGR